MAIFHEIRRPRNFDEAIRSSDNALNLLIVLLLIAFGLATWYFYATPVVDQVRVPNEPAGAQIAPSAAPVQPNPGVITTP